MEEEIIEQKMAGQSQWSDRELAALLQNATIKATDKFDVPPEILWVGDSEPSGTSVHRQEKQKAVRHSMSLPLSPPR